MTLKRSAIWPGSQEPGEAENPDCDASGRRIERAPGDPPRFSFGMLCPEETKGFKRWLHEAAKPFCTVGLNRSFTAEEAESTTRELNLRGHVVEVQYFPQTDEPDHDYAVIVLEPQRCDETTVLDASLKELGLGWANREQELWPDTPELSAP